MDQSTERDFIRSAGIECRIDLSPSCSIDDVDGQSFKGDQPDDDDEEARPDDGAEFETDQVPAEKVVIKIPNRMDGDEDPQYPDACFPNHWYEKVPILKGNDESPFWQGWAMLRLKTFRLIENKYFETAVIIMILLSSLALVNNLVYLILIKTNYFIFVQRLWRTFTCRKGRSCRTFCTTWIVFSRSSSSSRCSSSGWHWASRTTLPTLGVGWILSSSWYFNSFFFLPASLLLFARLP